MLKKVCNTCTPWGVLALRVAVGAILLYHGWPKLFGDTSMLQAFFESTVLPAPKIMLTVAGIIEVLGGAMLIVGLFTRYVATLVALQFVVIVLFVKLSNGWSAMELDVLMLATSFSMISLGGGKYSIDTLFCNGHEKQGPGHGAEAITGKK